MSKIRWDRSKIVNIPLPCPKSIIVDSLSKRAKHAGPFPAESPLFPYASVSRKPQQSHSTEFLHCPATAMPLSEIHFAHESRHLPDTWCHQMHHAIVWNHKNNVSHLFHLRADKWHLDLLLSSPPGRVLHAAMWLGWHPLSIFPPQSPKQQIPDKHAWSAKIGEINEYMRISTFLPVFLE